jgi:RNA polymerase sigma factor (sigma-70 family)
VPRAGRDATDALVEHLHPVIWAAVRSFRPLPHVDRRDLAQEAWLRVLARHHTRDAARIALPAWAYREARGAVIDFLRREHPVGYRRYGAATGLPPAPVSLTAPAHPADPAAGTVADATPGVRDTEREALARLEAAEVVRRARALSDRERAALSDVRRRDVAGRFAISETRVSQIARMARRKLRGET